MPIKIDFKSKNKIVLWYNNKQIKKKNKVNNNLKKMKIKKIKEIK